MKGCLKLSPMHSPVDPHHKEHDSQARCCNTPTQTHRKCVAFCAEGSETVYTADEWDRTPAEPARNLSYEDILELKAIQRSLPLTDQPADIITGRPGRRFLSGVPIVLLPLLSSGASPSESKKPCSDGWRPPGLTRQPQNTPTRPSFSSPPRPGPFSIPVSKSTFASIPISQSDTNFQLPKSAPSPPTSPTSPYPSSYSNRSSTTSASATYSYFHPLPPQSQSQSQSRMSWTRPPSLSHLLPPLPIKPREKPRFEFITVLDPGTRTRASSGPRPVVMSEGADGVEVATAKVGHPAVSLDPPSKPSSGLIETDHDDNEHDMESEARYYSLNGYTGYDLDRCGIDSDVQDGADRNSAAKLVRPCTTPNNPLSSPSGLGVDDKVEKNKTMKKKPELKKERKFIVVNDMEIELDDSEDEDDSGLLERTTTNMTTETTTTMTTTTITRTTEKTTTTTMTTTTTTSSGSPSSPLSIVAPVSVKLSGGSHSLSLPSSASLITPPTTPPRTEQVSRYGSHTNMKPIHSPTPSPSIANRGRLKVIQKIGHVVASSTSRDRSGSVGSDTSCGTSPSRNVKSRMASPAKFKSKTA